MAHRRSEASTVTRLGTRSRAGAALSRAGRTQCAPTLGVSLLEALKALTGEGKTEQH
jgi:hypothetical protein